MKGKYSKYFNENFFEVIDSEIKAYLLGFMFADGNIEQNFKYGTYRAGIHISAIDKHIAYLFQQYIDPYSNIHFSNVITRKNKLNSTMCSLRFSSKKLIQDLINQGCIPRKTYEETHIPNLPDDLMFHFIRGYFDGDGHTYVFKSRNSYAIRVGFTSEYHTLKDMETFLNKKGIYCYLELKENICYRLYINRKEDIQSFYHAIYDNANFFFSRKRNIMKKCMLTPREIREFYFRTKDSNPRNE